MKRRATGYKRATSDTSHRTLAAIRSNPHTRIERGLIIRFSDAPPPITPAEVDEAKEQAKGLHLTPPVYMTAEEIEEAKQQAAQLLRA